MCPAAVSSASANWRVSLKFMPSVLQIQEKLTAQIANTINDVLKPQGVGVVIKASHHCMTTRGVHKPDTDLVTSRMLGCFRDNSQLRQEFLGQTA